MSRSRWPRGVDGLCYGGDYNPEQWPEEVWHADVELMRRAGVNLVTVGVFAWARLEPRPGEHDFGWLDRVLDLLDAGGVKVALATPTASPPPWFTIAHPDALNQNADGVRLTHGSRDTYCIAAPAYRAAAKAIAGALATRYAGHPALALWHVHNEYGTWCHCDHIAAAFRDWLRRRHRTLDRLNEAWTTSFWSQHYADWAYVLPPRATQYLANPAQQLDFRRFLSDELLDGYREQRDILRAATPDVPVTTNFVLGSWVPVEHWSWSSEVDLVAIDHYPTAVDGRAEEETAFAADLARGWAGGEWLLMEQAPNLIYTAGRMHAKEPGRMARHSLSHLARGSRGAMFFQWRAPVGGAEQFHSALVPHAGPDSRIFREACELGEVLTRLSEVAGDTIGAEVAILWDDEAWWALQAGGLPSERLDYLAQHQAVHSGLWRSGVAVDFVRPGSELSAYRMVLIPSLYLVSDAAAEVVRGFVAGGGHLAVWFFSGIADPDPRVRLGGHPAAFKDILGVRVPQWHPLDGDQYWREDVELHGATAVSSYVDDPLAGRPAVTRHDFGAGVAWYVSTVLDRDALSGLLAELVRGAGIEPVVAGLPAGVEAVRRRSAEHSWLFLINHTTADQVVSAAGFDLVSGVPVDSTITVAAGAYAVIQEYPLGVG